METRKTLRVSRLPTAPTMNKVERINPDTTGKHQPGHSDLYVAQREMGGLTGLIFDLDITSDFRIALALSPLLGGTHQTLPYSQFPNIGIYVPALDERYRCRATTFCV